MPAHDIVVIGASSGGIEALGTVMRGLPEDLPAALFVVQHIAVDSTNYLPQMLDRETSLTVKLAGEGETIQPGTVYVAPADRHLLIDADQMFLSRGPRENRARPAVDPLFRSAALSHGPRVIGVILSGSLDDGTAGLVAVKKRCGLAVVQDPKSAVTPDMPQSALDHVDVDHCVPADEIGRLLSELVGSELDEVTGIQAGNSEQAAWQREVDIVRQESGEIDTAEDLVELVAASCPECGGPL